jgi:hypothetical protein
MNLAMQLPDPAHAAYAERALRFALTRFTDAVDRVRLRLVDENGPRGGPDKRCAVRVTLRQGGVVYVTGLDSDIRTVVDQVASRVARAVARHLDRARPPRLVRPNH